MVLTLSQRCPYLSEVARRVGEPVAPATFCPRVITCSSTLSTVGSLNCRTEVLGIQTKGSRADDFPDNRAGITGT